MRRLFALLLLFAAPAMAVDVYGLGDTVGAGYTARANGMDLDDDFDYGEFGVDDLACDSATNLSAGPIAEDVDGDAVNEAQIYIRPGVGTDNASCGGTSTSSSGGACATLQYAIDNRMNTQTGEDYFCIYTGDGTNAVEQIKIGNIDGDAGTKTRTAVGLEQVNYQYPSNPHVIMGADWDNDGNYPPYDTDDHAIFDGNDNSYGGQITLQDNLDGTLTSITIEQSIPGGTPASGTIQLTKEGGEWQAQTYTSWSGSTFTIPSTVFTGNIWAGSPVGLPLAGYAAPYTWFLKENYGGETNDTDRWEYAHFTVQDYANDAFTDAPSYPADARQNAQAGSWEPATLTAPTTSDHIYRHDVEMKNILKLMEPRSGMHFMVNGWGHGYSYYAIENITCIDCCGYVTRGSIASNVSTHLRVRNTTFTDYCEDTASEITGGVNTATGPKIWGRREGMEWLYNNWDWTSGAQFTGTGASCEGKGWAIVDNCQRDVYILGNKVTNASQVVGFGGGLERGCQDQNADNFHFAYNYHLLNDPNCANFDAVPVSMTTSFDDPEWFSEDKYVYNNFFIDNADPGYRMSSGFMSDHNVPVWTDCTGVETPWECCDGGGPTSGCTPASVAAVNAVKHVLANNVFYSDNWRFSSAGGGVYLLEATGDDIPSTVIIKNNMFIGAGDGLQWRAINIIDQPYSLDLDYNIYDLTSGDPDWYWTSHTNYETLALLSAATSQELNGKGLGQDECLPTFESSPLDLHLTSGDTCARDAGVDMSTYFTDDYDRGTRPYNVIWDIGADEYGAGTPEPPGSPAGCTISGVTMSGLLLCN